MGPEKSEARKAACITGYQKNAFAVVYSIP